MKSSELFEILKGFNETKVLRDKVLVKVKLKKAVFAQGEIAGTDFTGAKLAGADFSAARINDTKFEKAGIKKGSFADAALLRVLFAGADLNVVKFNGADVKESDFSGAVCEFSEFTSARVFKSGFVGANFKASNMDGADFSEADFSKADLSDCSFKNAKVSNSNMAEASLSDINAAGAVFANVGFVKADVSFADLMDASFKNCDFTDASFKYTDISRVTFDGCKLDNVNFKGAIGLTEEMREIIVASGGKVSKRPLRSVFNFFAGLIVGCFSFLSKKIFAFVPGLCSRIGTQAAHVCGMDKSMKVKASAYCLMYILLVVLILSAIKAFLAVSCMAGRCPGGMMMVSGGPNGSNMFVPGSDGYGDSRTGSSEVADNKIKAALGPMDANGDVLDLEHAPVIPFEDGSIEVTEGCSLSPMASWDKAMCMNADEETIKFSFDRTFVGDWPLGVFDPETVNFKRYQTGITVAPDKKIRFFLGGKFKEFYAVATIPPEASKNTKASFLVYLDGKLACESRVLQHPMAEPLSVDVSGARCMDIKTKLAFESDNTDYLTWGNAVCIKQPEDFVVAVPVAKEFPAGLVPLTPYSPELAQSSANFVSSPDVCLLGNSYAEALKLKIGNSIIVTLEPDKYSALRATIGFDTKGFPPIKSGEAQLRAVSDDGQMLFSDFIVFGDAKDINIDLAGVKQFTLSLEVVKGDPDDLVFADAGFVVAGQEDAAVVPVAVAVPEKDAAQGAPDSAGDVI